MQLYFVAILSLNRHGVLLLLLFQMRVNGGHCVCPQELTD